MVFPLTLAPGYRGFQINLNRPPFGPLNDPTARNIRWAIQLASDREELNILTRDGIGFISTPYFKGWDWIYSEEEWIKTLRGYDSTPAVKQADIAEAQRIMQEEGFSDDNRLETSILCTASVQRECEVTQDQLKEIFIDVKVFVLETAARLERRDKGDFDLYHDSVGMAFPDADAFNVSIFQLLENGGRLANGWSNPEWDALLEREIVLDSQEKRAPLLRQMAQIFHEDAHFIGMIRLGLLQGYRGNWRGYVPPLIHASNYTLESVWLAK